MAKQISPIEARQREMLVQYASGAPITEIAKHFGISEINSCRAELKAARLEHWPDKDKPINAILAGYDVIEAESAMAIERCVGKEKKKLRAFERILKDALKSRAVVATHVECR